MKTINVTFKHSTVDRLSDGRVLVCFDHMCSQVLNTKCQINFWINLAQPFGGYGDNFSFRETAGLMGQVYLICCVFVQFHEDVFKQKRSQEVRKWTMSQLFSQLSSCEQALFSVRNGTQKTFQKLFIGFNFCFLALNCFD